MKKMMALLSFRLHREDILGFTQMDLYVGLFFTWLVGMGRYWDHPKAEILQYLGVGSVIYALVFSAFIFAILWPLKIEKLSYKNVLTYVSLTSFPALLYAIPVEKWTEFSTAASLNAYFLTIVATWRVALLLAYLKKFAGLGVLQRVVVGFLPLTLIITLLTALNLEKAVFNFMGAPIAPTTRDTAYQILNLLTMLSVLFFIPLLLGYGVIVYRRRKSA
ncbi:hypothetical protein [Bdellovibrio sp. HCB337]|uniref:hypothetical protein n=1 Tax=Bdellovibrio sp. HCB337 TaxID=3394358 RepID=UPI0039A5AEC0